MNNAESFKINLTAKDYGSTGFQCAYNCEKYEGVNLIKRKIPNIAFIS